MRPRCEVWEPPSCSFFLTKKRQGGAVPRTPDRAPSSPSLEMDRATERRRGEKKKASCFFFSPWMPIEARVERGREKRNPETTPVDGYLGSREDEERSETRYVMRIAGTSEPSNLRTHLALPAPPGARPSERRPKTRRPPHPSLFGRLTGDRPGPVAASPCAKTASPEEQEAGSNPSWIASGFGPLPAPTGRIPSAKNPVLLRTSPGQRGRERGLAVAEKKERRLAPFPRPRSRQRFLFLLSDGGTIRGMG